MDDMQNKQDHDDSRSLFERLKAEEPPLDQDDTSPSVMATAPRPATQAHSDIWQQYLGSMMLLAALIFTVAAGLVIFLSEEDTTGNPEVVSRATETLSTLPPTPFIIQSSPIPSIQAVVDPALAAFLPTAAVDEAAISLLTPVPMATSHGISILRVNPPFTRRSGGAERQLVTYTIQSGDTLDSLTQRYNLSDKCTIIWSNDRRMVSPLRVGNQVLIPPVDGVFYKIREQMSIGELAEITSASVESIIESPYNPDLVGATADSLLVEGMQIMVPNGNGGDCNIWVAQAASDSGDGTGGGTSFVDISQTIDYYGLKGCNFTLGQGGWPGTHPVLNSQFFQGFSAYHTGVDFSASPGTPIVASGAGTVIFAGWNQYGYGNTVVIAHASTFTLYAHMLNRPNVNCGQAVSAGQVIGSVGSSGNSSGPHLHFEIRNMSFDPSDPCYTISC